MEVEGGDGRVVPAAGRLYQDEHPMLNPLILVKILELGKPDVETLKIIRLVCKTWNMVCQDLWRNTATLKLIDDESFFRRKSQGGLPLTQFFNRFEDPNDPFGLASQPFARYKILEITIDMSLSEEEGPCKRFWDDVGPLMEYLHLEHCLFPKVPRKQFDKMLFSKVPNLAHLVITETGLTVLRKSLMPPQSTAKQMRRERKTWREQRHQNLLRLEFNGSIPVNHPYKVIGRLPNLESLKLRNGEKKEYGDTISLLSAMSKLSLDDTGRKLKLKELDLMHTNGFARWFTLPQTLSEWKLPLEVLTLEIRADQSRNEQPLQPFLEHHASTLRVLKVFSAPLSNPAISLLDNFPFEFNQEVLEELYLWGNITMSFKFLKFMPSLKKIFISRICVDKWPEIKAAVLRWNNSNMYRGRRRNRVAIQPFNENMVQNAIQQCDMSLVMMPDIVHLHIDYDFDCDSLSKLAEWMPNLKKLETILGSSNFPVVCEKWPKIEELVCLFGSEIDDVTLTGWKKNKDEEMERDQGVRAISDLEYLKSFELKALCNKGKLTDASVVKGFLLMKRLDTLKICVSAQFTSVAEESLAKHIPNLQIIRNYGFDPHENYDCCEMNKFQAQVGRLQPMRIAEENDESDEWDSLESDLDIDVVSVSSDDDDDVDDDDEDEEDEPDELDDSEDMSGDDWEDGEDIYEFGPDSDFNFTDDDEQNEADSDGDLSN